MAKKTFMEKFKNIGPSAIITSAFIGPGTITTTTLAGIDFKYSLLWAVLFSGISLAILMEMSGRVGIISKHDIVEASTASLPNYKWIKPFITVLVVVTLFAVSFGFEAGNLTGGALGLSDITGLSTPVSSIILGVICLYVAGVGTAKNLETLMSFFVGIMGIIFVVTMVFVRPDYKEVLQGLLVPSIPEGSIVNVIALIGTTLIGMNLLMHAINASEKWDTAEDLADSRFDINFNVGIGTLITLAIVVTSGTVLYGTGVVVDSPLVFSKMLEPVLGDFARYLGDIGIIAAGMSSAIATPLTIKIVLARILKKEQNSSIPLYSSIAVVLFGTVFSALGTAPTQIIVFAAALSGIMLPIIAILIMISANNEKLMGKYKNTLVQNILGGIATVITLILSINSIINFLSKI